MLNPPGKRSALFGLACSIFALACGSPVQSPENYSGDAYAGVIDGSVLAAAFQPNVFSRSTCLGASNCYMPQTGLVAGKSITFFNALAVQTANLPTSGGQVVLGPGLANHNSDGTGGFHGDTFRNATCTPGPYNPVFDAFPTEVQAPVIDALPVATTSTRATAITYPLVAVYDVTGTSGQCNDIKRHDSVPGLDGSVRSDNPVQFEVWMPMDPAAGYFDLTLTAAPMPLAWFKGLQLGMVSGAGNVIPQNADGTFKIMDGALVSAGSGFSKPTDKNAVVLPYAPGSPSYSPIVYLHDFKAATGKKVGDYKGICQTGQTCPANYIKASDIAKVSPFNTIFIVASAQ